MNKLSQLLKDIHELEGKPEIPRYACIEPLLEDALNSYKAYLRGIYYEH